MNMQVYEKVRAVPQEALKAINGGRLKGMSDINPMWRIKMLTETFGMCGVGWKTVITDKRLERGGGDEIVCFVDIDLYVKVDGAWSEPIPGMGGSSFVTMERGGVYTSDECFKMAYTDAISVACKSLGFAADVYFANDRTKYTQNAQDAPQTPQEPKKEQTYSKPVETAVSSTTNTGDVLISAAQKGMVRALIKEKSIPEDTFKAWVKSYGVSSSNDLKKSHASAIIKMCQEYVAPMVPVGTEDDLPF